MELRWLYLPKLDGLSGGTDYEDKDTNPIQPDVDE